MTKKELKTLLESIFPSELASSWDNVGFQVGSLHGNVTNILTCLDVTPQIIEEAIALDCNVIISHHPLLFMPMQVLDTEEPIGALIQLLIKHKITVYSAHTNYDTIKEGMSYQLAKLLGYTDTKPLIKVTDELGYGVLIEIDETPVMDVITHVKNQFGIDSASYIGDLTSSVKKIALLGGSGKDDLAAVSKMGVDLYITGDITYHFAVDAKLRGLDILDIGHFIESFGVKGMQEMLSKQVKCKVYVSSKMENPYKKV